VPWPARDRRSGWPARRRQAAHTQHIPPALRAAPQEQHCVIRRRGKAQEELGEGAVECLLLAGHAIFLDGAPEIRDGELRSSQVIEGVRVLAAAKNIALPLPIEDDLDCPFQNVLVDLQAGGAHLLDDGHQVTLGRFQLGGKTTLHSCLAPGLHWITKALG
jgi:hypothetical protein